MLPLSINPNISIIDFFVNSLVRLRRVISILLVRVSKALSREILKIEYLDLDRFSLVIELILL